jgi:hypothetical protein
MSKKNFKDIVDTVETLCQDCRYDLSNATYFDMPITDQLQLSFEVNLLNSALSKLKRIQENENSLVFNNIKR